MKQLNVLTLLLFVLLSGAAYSQCQCDYAIDTDGDMIPEGTLYKDIVYDITDLGFYNDFSPVNPSITYAKDRELYNGTLTDLKMDVYYPITTDTCANKDKPVIFFFYGGGFAEGTSIRVRNLCEEYAQRGYITVAPNYRLGFYGAYEADSANVCDDLLGPAKATVRALLDAQAAIKWMKDYAADTLGFDIDTNHLYVHGPSIFPMLSVMNADEMPNPLLALGSLDDNIRIGAAVGRSTAMNLVTRFIDNDDDTPLLMFHGTCDKSVPFFKASARSRYGCDSLPVSYTGNYVIYGPEIIRQVFSNYYEFYPFCGLHHSLKKVEQGVMKQIVADFFYNVYCGYITPTDTPKIVPHVMDTCDISGKCIPADFSWPYCATAPTLPVIEPCGEASELVPETESLIWSERVGVTPKEIVVYPNPTSGNFMLSYRAEGEEVAIVRIFDLMGKEVFSYRLAGLTYGTNLRKLTLPADVERGVYLVQVNGFYGPKLVIE